MKIIVLFLMLQTVVLKVFSQKYDSTNLPRLSQVNTKKDKQEYQGYTIKLKPGNFDSYEFEISKDNKPMVSRFQNPLAFSPKGIRKKDDAFKIAQWIIDQYTKTGHWEKMVPPHVARQLRIEFN